jgi:hypothetical protein
MTKKTKAAAAEKPSETAFPGGKFIKGHDPRRCLHGRKCKSLIEFEQRFKRELARGGDVKQLVRLIWDRALQGKEWAIQVLLDRAIGRPAIKAELSTESREFVVKYAAQSEVEAIDAQRKLDGLPPLSLSSPVLPRPLLGFVETVEAPASAQPAAEPDADDDIFINVDETEDKNER